MSPQSRRQFAVARAARAQALGLAEDGTPQLARDLAFAQSLPGELLDAASRRTQACSADRAALSTYSRLGEQGLISRWEQDGNVAILRQRVAANCD